MHTKVHKLYENGLKLLDTEKKVVGIKQTKRNISADNVKLIYIAKDADPIIINPLVNECKKKNIDIVEVETSAMLGKSCGIDINCSVCALLK